MILIYILFTFIEIGQDKADTNELMISISFPKDTPIHVDIEKAQSTLLT